MSLGHGVSIIRNGLVMHLDTANTKSYPGTGTGWSDLSGQGSNFSLSTNVTYSDGNQGVLNFNGVDSVTSGIVQSPVFTGITLNIFYKSNISSSSALLIGTNNYFILHFRGAGFYLVGSDAVASGYLGWSSEFLTNRLIAGSWNMMTATWNGTTMKLYCNSVKQNAELAFTGGANNQLRTPYNATVGGYFNSTQPWTNGQISNCQIYNRALTDDEISQNFEALRGRYGI